ncbi:MAG TPA: radical SAM protein [Gemmatimonadota bacterium]|nr:radical SAM protein [Gemmatimonadota bacterium]
MSALAIMLTRRCNMACAHCSVESGPKAGGRGPSLDDLLASVGEAAAAGVGSVIVTGGEPMLRERATLAVVRECRRLGVTTRIATNGFWGRTRERARRTLGALLEAGLSGLTVSYDRFHADFQGPEPVVHIAEAAAALGFRFDVNVTRLADDAEIESLVAPFAELPSVRLRFYDVQPVGAARSLPGADLRAEVDGFCSACGIPALTDDGRLTACNGPSYFSPADSPLSVGSLAEAPLGELLARHRADPVLDTIRTDGPTGLRDALLKLPGFESFPFRDRYAGMCELCHHVTSSPAAVAVLRTALAAPDRTAHRLARTRVMESERTCGVLSRGHANTAGAARVFVALAAGEELSPEVSGRVLGRADLDWRAQAEALVTAGLAHPLVDRLADPALTRWAPALFGSLLRRAAVADAARGMEQREALRRLAATLREMGAEGTIVGGAASWSWEAGGADSPARSVRAIEVVVDPRIAARLGAPSGAGARSLPVAIRTRLSPAEWGLPEEEMIGAAHPIDPPGLEGLRRLLPTDALIHGLVEASARGLRGGLETAWDARAALRLAGEFDVERAAAIVGAMATRRAFWVPARALAEGTGLPIPASFLTLAPDDARQRRLERIASARLFATGPSGPVAERLLRWAWPALAADSAAGVARRLPAAAVRAAREVPSAWREIGRREGLSGAVREAGRAVRVWTSATAPR